MFNRPSSAVTLGMQVGASGASIDTQGSLIAGVLSRSWQQNSTRSAAPVEHLNQVARLLLKSGAAALAWSRISSLDLEPSQSIQELQEAYRLHSIESALHEYQVKDVFTMMRAAGVEPLLFKGWAMARLYPEPGVRPYGDIDLWVLPEQLQAADGALSTRTGRVYCVDLHSSFYKQYERSVQNVLDHSQLVPLDDVAIRVPCAEDHLRYLCLHFLVHGAWRPLWLCDIALAVESRPADFDWDRCLAGTQKYADWVACAIGLAHQLLSADISGTPVEDRAKHLPRWLIPAVLQQWERGSGMSSAETLKIALPRAIHPAKLTAALKEHWRNPIQASFELGAPFDERPRAPLQFAAGIKRLPNLTRELVRRFRDRH